MDWQDAIHRDQGNFPFLRVETAPKATALEASAALLSLVQPPSQLKAHPRPVHALSFLRNGFQTPALLQSLLWSSFGLVKWMPLSHAQSNPVSTTLS